MKKILIDVDGVVADIAKATQLALNIPEEDMESLLTSADFWDEFSPEAWNNFLPIMSDKVFWLCMPSIPGTFEVIENLRQCYSIAWVTAPSYECREWCWARENWLSHHMEYKDYDEELVFTENKYLVQGDTLIEDNIDRLSAWEKYNKKEGFLIKTPYTIHEKRLTYTLAEVVEILLKRA